MLTFLPHKRKVHFLFFAPIRSNFVPFLCETLEKTGFSDTILYSISINALHIRNILFSTKEGSTCTSISPDSQKKNQAPMRSDTR